MAGTAAEPGQGHPDRLADRGHRVGGEHPGARPGARACRPLDLEQLFTADPALRLGADALEDVDDRDVTPLVPAGKAGTAVEKHRREGRVGPQP